VIAEARKPRLRIAFLVRALTVGGAERQLLETARGLQARGHQVWLMVFYPDDGPLQREAAAHGIPVVGLEKRHRWDLLGFRQTLQKTIRDVDPDVVYSYLPSANVASSLIGRTRGRPAIVWSIRATDMSGESYDWLGHLAVAAERLLSTRADIIVVNSASGIAHHADRGLPRGRLRLVRNGVDLSYFRFDAQARTRLRAEWGITTKDPVVLTAGRHDPIKGIEIFLEALTHCTARAIIAGAPAEPYTTILRQRAEQLGLGARLRWIGRCDDMPALLSAVDVVCSASHSEGSPNVLIEARACGTVIVGTAVGDTADVVGDSHLLAAPGDAPGLAQAIMTGIELCQVRPRQSPAGDEIIARYDLDTMIRNTEAVLCEAIGHSRHRGAQGWS
jgi:glycosyltransferase involved in cell wall biosynthesis